MSLVQVEVEDAPPRQLAPQSFVDSALFERTFDEGMSLVEETARYLDGRGREESRALSRNAALLYAGESMRVTTRLMQAASWLLIQRAVREGEICAEDAASERYRLGSKEICFGGRGENVDMLPKTLCDLLARSEQLYCRIARLEEALLKGIAPAKPAVQVHFERLQQSYSGAV
jgi:regulator of CtrA degradation